MPDRSAFYDKLGAKALAPQPGAKPGNASMVAKPAALGGAKPPLPPAKGFDINIYFKAVGNAFDDFFNKKLPYFFKNLGPSFSKFPDWFSRLPNDEKASYGAFVFGGLLFVVGIVLLIVL
jgi:hypothetical protein